MRPRWRDILFGLILVSPPVLKKLLLRVFCGARISRSARIGWFSAVTGRTVVLGEHTRIRPLTLIRCGGDVTVGDYAEVSSFVLIYGAAGFAVGNHSYIGPQCLINADEDVRIGNVSALGPRCMVFTHGAFLPYTEGYPVKFAGVTVGDHTWIAAGVFLHPGVHVGDNVFVNSRAVVANDIGPEQVVDGAPARERYRIDKFRRRMTPVRVDAAMRQVLARFADVTLRGNMGINVTAEGEDTFRFSHARHEYSLIYIPAASNGVPSLTSEGFRRTRAIILCNNPQGLPATGGGRNVTVLDLSTMRTPVPRDVVHVHLIDFMRRYYGLQFEYEHRG